jgi:non-ribosomal peptide synthetase-like protein
VKHLHISKPLSVAKGPAVPELVRDETLSDLFAASVRLHGERIAISDALGSLSYAALDAEADRMARGLSSRGARPGQFVGLWMPRGREVLIAQVAIAKTGAAWVPFDADAPPHRILECLQDITALGIVLPGDWAHRLDEGVTAFPAEQLASAEGPLETSDASADDCAYVIYTSGSTGRPKGIAITHRNICHFLRAAELTYGLTAYDSMLQCSSIAFDLSLEEIWLPYLVGARLELCPAEYLADPEQLASLIRDRQVTAIDLVPTLLGLMDNDLGTVRLIIVGGEACPEGLVQRYASSGRTMINSYGPSEATVVATSAVLSPGAPISIGRPIPNMSCYVVDEETRLVTPGEPGELLLGGPGIARGYINRPELTAEKFIPNPFETKATDAVLYRTGDAVQMTEEGDLIFLGRIDDQIKIRGFRVELGEIEALLAREPGVAGAAVVVNRQLGFDQLVAFVVPRPDASLNAAALKEALRDHLPPYMVPNVIEAIDALPRLPSSGKVDRKILAERPLPNVGQTAVEAERATPTEAKLLSIAMPLFPGQAISLGADFFLDLGGHSLLAAQFVSAARKEGSLGHVTLHQLYEARSLRGVGRLLDAAGMPHPIAAQEQAADPPLSRRLLCGLAQLTVMPLLLVLMSAQWLAIFISYALVSGDNSSVVRDLTLVFIAYVGVNIAVALIVLAAKWLIIGRTKPGRYPLWGSYFFRVWLVQRMVSLVHLKWMQNSPLLRGYLRALGAKVGKDALISDFDAGAIDLLEFGAHVSTGSKTVFANANVDGAAMIVGKVKIGDDVSIGSSCAIEGDVEIGNGAELGDLTSLKGGTRIPAWEAWSGAPAVKTGNTRPDALSEPPAQTLLGRAARVIFYFLVTATLPAISVLPIVPAFRLMEWVDSFLNPVVRVYYLWYMPLLALSAGAGLIAATLLLIVACRWIVLPRVRPGRYSVTSSFFLRRWAMGLLTEAALDTLSSLFATVYMRVWYRMMGSKVGRGTEISTNFAGRYELIRLGAGNFIADDVVLGDDHLRRGWLELDTVETGDQVFIGNEAVVPQGYRIGSGALIGVKSKPPEGGIVNEGETWFGSPPIQLPTRQRFEHDARQTFSPPLRMKVGRALFEAFNITLPTALFITLVTIVMEILAPVFDRENWGKAIWICVLASVIIAIVQLLVAAAYKWLLMGSYRPTMKPMWSWWALKTEAVAVMYWGMAGKALLEQLRGTPFLPYALRLFGVKAGRGIYLDSADITEFDCVTIADFAVVNNHGCLQTHLYEDRMMKVGRIDLGKRAVVGAGSTVLYGTEIGDRAKLGPLTLVMKGEHILDGAQFEGSPARPMVS